MKQKITRLLLALVAMVILSGTQMFADEIMSKEQVRAMLPKYLGTNNSGTEFVMTFHPCWEESGKNNEIKVYVSSGKATNVTLKIPGRNYQESQITIPNGIIEFSLSPTIAQMYSKTDKEAPQPEQIWPGRAIILTADDPIIAYGVTRYRYTSDGYLAIPVSGLGKQYQVSSYEDPSKDNSGQYLTSYTSVVAAYDDTKVTVRFGGNGETWVPSTGGKIFNRGDVERRKMQKGDVWLIPGRGNYNDLSGTMVTASRPVAVISGSFCAYIPRGISACDFIIEQELPKNTWGTKYHVTQIIDRKKASIVKLFAKENNTQLFKEGDAWGSFGEVGVEENVGFYKRRLLSVDDPQLRPITISADKPISITQFNPGMSDDGIESDPFQLVLTPVEQYQTEIIFNTPGINGGAIFKKNYINLVYLATESGTIPDDLQWAQVVNGKFSWKQVSDFTGGPGKRLYDPEYEVGNRYYYAKQIVLPDPAGVYKFRADDPFTAYAYGFDLYDSYGFPTSVALADLSIPDTLPPAVEYVVGCTGNVTGRTIDEPRFNPENRSNMRSIYLDTDYGFNYKWKNSTPPDFVAGETYIVDWELEIIDPTQDALAYILFTDARGNETMTQIQYFSTDLSIVKSREDWGLKASDDAPDTRKFTLVNNRDKPVIFDSIELLLKSVADDEEGGTLPYQGFAIATYPSLEGPIQPNEQREFEVTFDPSIGAGSWRDSIGVRIIIDDEVCYYRFLSRISAGIGDPVITVEDITFPRQTIGTTSAQQQVVISNPGTTDLIITDYSGPTLATVYNTTLKMPITIEAGASTSYLVDFTPDAVSMFPDEIVFTSNANVNDNRHDPVGKLNGEGMEPGLEANGFDWGKRRVNLDKYATYPHRDQVQYLAENDAITLSNDKSQDSRITRVNIEDDEKGEAFLVEYPAGSGTWVPLNDPNNLKDIFEGRTVAAGTSLNFPVRFYPTTHGEHRLVLTYEADGASPQTVLAGIGIYPKIAITSINFTPTEPAIANDTPKSATFTIQNIDWKDGGIGYGDVLEIQDLVVDVAGTISEDGTNYGTQSMMWDRAESDLDNQPLILEIGESRTFDAYFGPVAWGNFTATVTTYSDAENDTTSTWVGEALDQDWIVGTDAGTICITDEYPMEIPVTNTAKDDLEIIDLKLVLNDGTEYTGSSYTIQETAPLLLASEDEIVINVNYAPQVAGAEPVYLQVTTDALSNNVQKGLLDGSAVHYPRTTSAKVDISTIDLAKGIETIDYRVFINAGSEDMIHVTENTTLKVTITYPLEFLGIRADNSPEQEFSAGNDLNGFTIANFTRTLNAAKTHETATFDLVGNRVITSRGELEILQIKFKGYLPKINAESPDLRKALIEHTVVDDEPCVTYATAEQPTITYVPICVDNLRVINISDDTYGLEQITPNPVGSEGAEINFSIGLDNVYTELNIYNSASELVAQPIKENMSSGKYTIPLPNLTSGVYFYEIKSGPFTEMKKVIVRK